MSARGPLGESNSYAPLDICIELLLRHTAQVNSNIVHAQRQTSQATRSVFRVSLTQ